MSHRVHAVLPVALALLLAACGGARDAAPPSGEQGRAGALAAAAPGELATWARSRLQGLDAQGRLAGSAQVGVAGMPVPVAAPAGAANAAAQARSRTLVQEDGVDEADLLLAQGRTLHALVRASEGPGGRLELLSQDLGGDGRLGAARRVPLAAGGDWLQPEGLLQLASGHALAAVSRLWEVVVPEQVCADCITIAPMWAKDRVQVQRVDTRDPDRAVPGDWLSIEGTLVDTRRIGDTLVVVAVHRPLLPVQALPTTATAAQRAAGIAAVTAAQLLPTLRRNGGAPEPLLRDTDCWLQPDNGSLAVQLTTVTLVNLADARLPQTTRCFAGGTEAVYLTTQNLWLATTRDVPLAERGSSAVPPPPRTLVHQFALDLAGTAGLAWRGSAVVEGHLGWDRERTSYRFSEHAGHLRVLTYTGTSGWASPEDAATRAASPARLTVLRADSAAASADGRTLATVGVLPNERRPSAIGKPDEQVYAVRFAGSRGYVVTFRQVDPLYVMDLSDPADPRLAGEVQLPGFSQVLLPLNGGLLLGLGRDADAEGQLRGLQLALFDVADAAAPRLLQALTLGQAGSASALEFARHGLALRVDGSVARLALPVILTDAPWGGQRRGLQTFTVDTAARTLALRSLHGAVDGGASVGWLGDERAALVDEQVLHLRDGGLAAYGW
jgi:hypothetical protein